MVIKMLTYYYEYLSLAYALDFISKRYTKEIKHFIFIELKS